MKQAAFVIIAYTVLSSASSAAVTPSQPKKLARYANTRGKGQGVAADDVASLVRVRPSTMARPEETSMARRVAVEVNSIGDASTVAAKPSIVRSEKVHSSERSPGIHAPLTEVDYIVGKVAAKPSMTRRGKAQSSVRALFNVAGTKKVTRKDTPAHFSVKVQSRGVAASKNKPARADKIEVAPSLAQPSVTELSAVLAEKDATILRLKERLAEKERLASYLGPSGDSSSSSTHEAPTATISALDDIKGGDMYDELDIKIGVELDGCIPRDEILVVSRDAEGNLFVNLSENDNDFNVADADGSGCLSPSEHDVFLSLQIARAHRIVNASLAETTNVRDRRMNRGLRVLRGRRLRQGISSTTQSRTVSYDRRGKSKAR